MHIHCVSLAAHDEQSLYQRKIGDMVRAESQVSEAVREMTFGGFLTKLKGLKVLPCGVLHEEKLTKFGECGMRETNLACCHQRDIDGGDYAANTLRQAINLAESLGQPVPDVYHTMLGMSQSVQQLFQIDQRSAERFYPYQNDPKNPDLSIIREELKIEGAVQAGPMEEAHQKIVEWFESHVVPNMAV